MVYWWPMPGAKRYQCQACNWFFDVVEMIIFHKKKFLMLKPSIVLLISS